MFFLTSGYLEIVFKQKSLFEAAAQSKEVIATSSKIRLNENCVPVVKITEITKFNDDMTRLLLTDGSLLAYIFIDDKSSISRNGQLVNGSVVVIRDFIYLTLSSVIEMFGGTREHYILGTEAAVKNETNTVVICGNIQIVGLDLQSHESEPSVYDVELKYLTIKDLQANLKNSCFKLKALLTKRSEIKHFTSPWNKSGCFARYQFSDCTGTIEMVAFNEFCTLQKLDLVIDRVYCITAADTRIKKPTCDAWTSSVGSDYEIVFTKNTEFLQLDESSESFIPASSSICHTNSKPSSDKHTYSDTFTELEDLGMLKLGSLVDVLGIVTAVDPLLKTIPRKNGAGKDLFIKNFEISSRSKYSIRVAMWGLEAEYCDIKCGQVFEMRKIKLTNYNGLSLSKLMISSIKDVSHVENEAVHQLKESFRQMKRSHESDAEINDTSKKSKT